MKKEREKKIYFNKEITENFLAKNKWRINGKV